MCAKKNQAVPSSFTAVLRHAATPRRPRSAGRQIDDREFVSIGPINTLSLARVHLCPLAAGVAFDVAAPQELAVALPDARVLVRVISPAAAHQIAAADVLHHGLVAHAALRAQAPRAGVRLAVVGRLVYVHQLRIHGLPVRVRFLDLEEFRALVAAGFDRFHVHGVGILLLENVAQLAELGECSPAGFGGAGA